MVVCTLERAQIAGGVNGCWNADAYFAAVIVASRGRLPPSRLIDAKERGWADTAPTWYQTSLTKRFCCP
ncbi:hypothetical protein IQ17_03911 [Bradyrhizobium daqingense]|uniref:Uncharacterized protein n=2 Tax=Bradyrhizobium daqingense TaxID=993502 RepID=A0A562L9B3_9BRAD|nr:hypothetical protein IQ17_03911 [Bradyrhizobium daqingense]